MLLPSNKAHTLGGNNSIPMASGGYFSLERNVQKT